MKKYNYEVKIVHYDPNGNESLSWCVGDTKEELDYDIKRTCEVLKWDMKDVELRAVKDQDDGRWYEV